MTIHASKGLEFDMVIIAGVSDMIIPDRSGDIEEERRLMYVALTRARNTLHIIFHKNDDAPPRVFRANSELRVSSLHLVIGISKIENTKKSITKLLFLNFLQLFLFIRRKI